MSSETMQEMLFQDPIGLRLRQGREQAGLSVEQVAQQLKLPVAIVKAMELDDWARLGAPVYVRSYLGSYLRLVGLPAELCESAARTKAPPALVALGAQSGVRRKLDNSMRNIVYFGLTAMLVVPVVLVAKLYQAGGAPERLTLDTPAPVAAQSVAAQVDSPVEQTEPAVDSLPMAQESSPAPSLPVPVPGTQVPPAAGSAVGSSASEPAHPAPVMASMAPFPAAASTASELLLQFKGESWVDVVDPQGQRLERGLVAAGMERRYAAGQVARITLGRADVVDVSYAGRQVDTTPYRAANVARFTVSSSGEPAPAGN